MTITRVYIVTKQMLNTEVKDIIMRSTVGRGEKKAKSSLSRVNTQSKLLKTGKTQKTEHKHVIYRHEDDYDQHKKAKLGRGKWGEGTKEYCFYKIFFGYKLYTCTILLKYKEKVNCKSQKKKH